MRRPNAPAVCCSLLLVGLVTRAQAEEPRLVQPPQQVTRLATLGGWRTVVIPEPVTASRTTPAPRPGVATASLPHRALVGPAHALNGIASYYWQPQMTSSGERFDRRGMTAAHRTLPLGTRVKVTHVASGRTVVVRINDRGPFKPGRVIDLSEAAAEQLGMTAHGLAQVRIDLAPPR